MLYAWGANNYGQLGLGYISEQEEIPKHVNIEHEFVKIIGGGGHTLALDSDGNLFVCGWNRFGQLGIESDENLTRFTRTDVSGVVDVAAGWDFSLLLLQDGTVLSAGSNKFFQLGSDELSKVGSSQFKKVPGPLNFLGIKIRIEGRSWKDVKDSLPARIPDLNNVTRISCGQFFTVLGTSENKLFGFGSNKFNEISSTLEKIIPVPTEIKLSGSETVSCGWTHVVCLRQDRCHAWGRNNYFQCGRGHSSGSENICDEGLHLVAQDESPSLKVRKVISGSEHCLALDGEGRVYSWGWNEHGNCGTGDTENVSSPTKIQFDNDKSICDIFVGSAHCFALTSH
ncbi:secretion-regulating guanine nucleotide exchange factor isoform X5 [Eurytemora carolleeae]|uniref:secretion-regulating guanine nucleotide exchange factor isoform X5 n=1 Tax=Eurytemora carolleeae TaxID=1294199 RepID=UPI000C75F46B|nr:secretion-regulating guanine nucleotide exchange factor isoform X5 [Eurytemora carolleeae]|eukprot:XP_023321398.1 secretion-regulating guanine nucleotide exchange factor-like isoform X5 [Eurytemora affinis]